MQAVAHDAGPVWLGLTLLGSTFVGAVAAILIVGARHHEWCRHHRLVWLIAVSIGYAALMYGLWRWALMINSFPATFGPLVFIMPAIGAWQERRRAQRPVPGVG